MAPLTSGPITATSSRATAPGSPAIKGRTSAAVGAGTGPGRAAAAGTSPTKRPALEARGTRRELVSSHPTVVDGKLVRNVQRSQGQTGRQGRVWVDKRGAGLSKLDMTPPPPAALTRRGAYQITKVGAPEQRLSGPS
jgi:hypothetical protein